MELTAEQKKKFDELKRSSTRVIFFSVLQAILLLIAADSLIIIMNAFTVQSQGFVFVGSCMNAFFIFSHFGRNLRKEHDRIKLEVKNILDN